MAYEGEQLVDHNEIRDNIIQITGKIPANPYEGLDSFLEFIRKGRMVKISPLLLPVIDAFDTDDSDHLIRIGEDTEKLGYSNFNIRRAVDAGRLDGFVIDRIQWREHFITITESEVKLLKKMYNHPEKVLPYSSKNTSIKTGNPTEILSLLEAEGHGKTLLADKIRLMWLDENILPSHIMYDVKKILCT